MLMRAPDSGWADAAAVAAGFEVGPLASAREPVNMVYKPEAARPIATVRYKMRAFVFMESKVLGLIQDRLVD